MDQLEKYIRDHHDEFDGGVPGDGPWREISRRLAKESRVRPIIRTWMWKAASIVLLISVAGLLVERQIRQSHVETLTQTSDQLAGFRQVEGFYTSLITHKRAEITNYLDSNPAFRNEFTADITQLDSMYTILKEDLRENYNEKIIDAMTVNLMMQIEILNQQLEILKKIKTNQENEKTNI